MGAEFDVVIIGGGPAGSTAATLLAEAGWAVALIEKDEFPRRKVCGEYLSATTLPLLERLGVLQPFLEQAGPEIKRVGLFARDIVLTFGMPRPRSSPHGWGRALGREHLDTLLLERAAKAGATVWQPWSVVSLSGKSKGFACRATSKATNETKEFCSRLVIAAHGSWETGQLPSHTRRWPVRGSDLLAFKAHLRNVDVPLDLMPLLAFPGGYGGIVHSDNGRQSLSCCVRRDWLPGIRQRSGRKHAAEALLQHIKESCTGALHSLTDAIPDGPWLSVAPIRPAVRRSPRHGIFLIGNAAGEAHPIIAEGISMAMQSAWLLSGRLVAERGEALSEHQLEQLGHAYEKDWRSKFVPRIRAAALFAHLAIRPTTTKLSLHLLRLFPALLTWSARWSGKAEPVVVL